MGDSAPRYDQRLVDAITRFDDRRVPIAETCRRLADHAEALGLPRPSYVHLRRLIVEQRLCQDERRELALDAVRLVYEPSRTAADSLIERLDDRVHWTERVRGV